MGRWSEWLAERHDGRGIEDQDVYIFGSTLESRVSHLYAHNSTSIRYLSSPSRTTPPSQQAVHPHPTLPAYPPAPRRDSSAPPSPAHSARSRPSRAPSPFASIRNQPSKPLSSSFLPPPPFTNKQAPDSVRKGKGKWRKGERKREREKEKEKEKEKG